MNRGALIAIFGISGVGKSWLCNYIASRIQGILVLSASTLLREILDESGEALRTSSAGEIVRNQFLLHGAVAAARSGRWERAVLLDAHNVIDNDHELVEVPAEAIRPLDARGMLFIEADPKIIRARRALRARASPTRTIHQLKYQQEYAREICTRYSSELKIPLEIVTTDNPVSAVEFVGVLATRGAD